MRIKGKLVAELKVLRITNFCYEIIVRREASYFSRNVISQDTSVLPVNNLLFLVDNFYLQPFKDYKMFEKAHKKR